jgi:hypothetical protein
MCGRREVHYGSAIQMSELQYGTMEPIGDDTNLKSPSKSLTALSEITERGGVFLLCRQ